MNMRGQLAPGKRQAYVMAGNATVTIVNPKTGGRFTYRIRKADSDKPLSFVSLLSGPDNESSYRYIGIIVPDQKCPPSLAFRMTAKSTVRADAPSAIAFTWFSQNWESEKVEVWHEGICGRCGRKLTVPESIESGIGPVCEGRD